MPDPFETYLRLAVDNEIVVRRGTRFYSYKGAEGNSKDAFKKALIETGLMEDLQAAVSAKKPTSIIKDTYVVVDDEDDAATSAADYQVVGDE